MTDKTKLAEEFRAVINRNSAENGSDTPDFILAELLAEIVEAFDNAVVARERWYGRKVGGGVSIIDPGPVNPPTRIPSITVDSSHFMDDTEYATRIVNLMNAYNIEDDLVWRMAYTDRYGEILRVAILCSDLFDWGTADYEPIEWGDFEDLEMAIKDAIANDGYGTAGLELFVARKRKMRPQGAAYRAMPEKLAALFDVCGPVREVNVLNPVDR